MSADLQDAVTLAGELERTPLQAAAKRVYDALVDANSYLHDLRDLEGGEEPFHAIDRCMERLFEEVVKHAHEDDCE